MAMILKNKRMIVYQKTNGICIICGERISDNTKKWSLEHYIPRAIYKWISSESLRLALEGVDNLFIVHSKCNFNKSSVLPNTNSIKKLPASNEIKLELLTLYKSVEKELSEFRKLKQIVLSKQNGKCFLCYRRIYLSSSNLRRLDSRKERIADNAMCLCHFCNSRTRTPSYKRKMVEKMISKTTI